MRTSGAHAGALDSSEDTARAAGATRVAPPLDALLALLDAHVVGHTDAKRALILGLAAREHVYLEGPPGTAKTRMAEVLARGCDLRLFTTQLHRDTRASDLLGDVVIERTPIAGGDGERVSHRIEPGRVLTAELCLLDDISRAPGEALNVLLRVLNERCYGPDPVPLLCAIATGNPTDATYANEPLDAAQLDRFTLQARVEGMLAAGGEAAARALLDRFADRADTSLAAIAPVVARDQLDAIFDRIGHVVVPPTIRAALIAILRNLIEEHGVREDNALLTDRTFLVKAVKLLRASAAVAGRTAVCAADLACLHWLTTFRLPAEVHAEMPALIARCAPGDDVGP